MVCTRAAAARGAAQRACAAPARGADADADTARAPHGSCTQPLAAMAAAADVTHAAAVCVRWSVQAAQKNTRD
jgi:hypothetical protein